MSILGKKIGATRVTVYGKEKEVVGVFDVEVSYDVSLLNSEIARFTGGAIRVSSINGRIMLTGTAADAATLDKAVTIARQFAPDVINTVQVTQPQQVMLEVRFIEASRQASRELGVQWNVFGNRFLANVGDQQPAAALPVAATTAAGVLSGSSPFGFLIGRLVGGSAPIDVALNALEQKGLIRNLAQPNLVALSGDTASFLAGGEYPDPGSGLPRPDYDRIQKVRCRSRLYADRIEQRPDQSRDQAECQPDRSHNFGGRQRHFGTGAYGARSFDHC